MSDAAYQKCINSGCGATFSVDEVKVACTKCGSLLDIRYDWSRLPVPKDLSFFEHRWSTKGTGTDGRDDFSGVWRFRELLPFYRTADDIVTIGEGRTVLQTADLLARQLGMNAGQSAAAIRGAESQRQLQRQRHDRRLHPRQNGRGKPRRLRLHRQHLAPASRCSPRWREMQGVVFIGSGKISFGKLSQALDYGALTLQIQRRLRRLPPPGPRRSPSMSRSWAST